MDEQTRHFIDLLDSALTKTHERQSPTHLIHASPQQADRILQNQYVIMEVLQFILGRERI